MSTETHPFTEHHSWQKHFPELAFWTVVDQKDVFSAAQPFIRLGKSGTPAQAMKARATLRRLAKSATITPAMEIHRNGTSFNSRWAS